MAVLAVVVLAVSLQLHDVPAAAGSWVPPRCVSVQEFETAPFARKAIVERFWDAPGRRTHTVEPGNPRRLMARRYNACWEGGWVVVVYRRTDHVAVQFWSWTPDERRGRRAA